MERFEKGKLPIRPVSPCRRETPHPPGLTLQKSYNAQGEQFWIWLWLALFNFFSICQIIIYNSYDRTTLSVVKSRLNR